MAKSSGSFKKGHKRPGPGRPKGTVNKATADARAAFNEILSGRVEKVGAWIDEIAETDKHKATVLLLDLAEFCIPKMSRQEHTGEGGGPVYVYSRNQHDDDI